MTRRFHTEIPCVPILSPQEARARPMIGLSTDLYFPPLSDLMGTLSNGPMPEYLEIFRGRTADLIRARKDIPPDISLAYHGDNLWYTQADFSGNPACREEMTRALRHMEVLDAPWMIHECAQKMMEGFVFGLYAPPLLTWEGAIGARQGALILQEALGHRLLLLETPPFPPHPPGPMDLGEFFSLMTRDTSLGVGLDLGHCLTYLSVAGYSPTPDTLVDWLGTSFPLERVVEIHLGGLARRLVGGTLTFIDDHAEPVPDLLFESLEAILENLRFPALAGIALEVDNKILPAIVREFEVFYDIIDRKGRPTGSTSSLGARQSPSFLDCETAERIRKGYAQLGREMSDGRDSLYRRFLYADELWFFGGAMTELFPETLSLLQDTGLDVRGAFADFFNRNPRSLFVTMDFLEIKVIRTLEWIETLSAGRKEAFSPVLATAEREASILLSAQKQFNGDPL